MPDPPGSVVRRRVRVAGVVQGVFFREGCRREAERLGAAGEVENLPDGGLEAVFEGPAEVVDALVRWCASGPPRARVDSLLSEEEQPTGQRGFVVRRSEG